MFRWIRTRRWKLWADGYDEGWDASLATYKWVIRKRVEKLAADGKLTAETVLELLK